MGAAQTQGVTIDIPLQHPYLRNCKALTKNKIIFLSATSVTQKPQYQKWKEQLYQFQRHNTDGDTEHEWLMLPIIHKFQQGGICSTTGELKLQYEYYPKLLSTQISERTLQKRKFNQPELWYLLYVLVAARHSLVLNAYQFGDLQPRNIFLNSNQQVKVGCLLSWPGEVSAYRKVVLQEDFGYLAPQDIERLSLGAMDNKNNTSSQIFAIGLTMLSASSLQQMKDLYRLKQKDMDEQLFATRVSVFQQDRIYSDIFRAVISNLLQTDVAKRMNQEQLYQFLNKHKQNLINKKPLVFDNVNKKLQESINQLFRLVPPLPRIPFIQQPPTQDKIKLQHSPIHRDLPLQSREIGRKNLKQQTARSLEKRNNTVHNDLNGAVPNIGINRRINPAFSPRSQALPINHHLQNAHTHFQQYPVPLPNSPRSLYPIQQQTIKQPLTAHQFQNRSQQTSPQKYKPFETLNNKQPAIQTINPVHQRQAMNTKIEQPDTPSSKNSKINELVSDSQEKSLMGGEVNLLMQTRRGFNIVEGIEVKPKEKTGDSRVSETPKLEEHSIIKNCKESELIIQKKASVSEKNHPKETPQKQIDNLLVANQKQDLVQSPRFKDPSFIAQEQQVKVQNEIKKQPQQKESIESIPLQSVEKIAVLHVQPQVKLQSKKPQIKPQIPLDSRFTPSIKVWGMQKGQLTVQQVSKSPLASSQTQKKEEHKDKINIIQQTKEYTFSEKSANSVANENGQKQTLESQKSIKSHQSLQIVKPERKEQQNYILIQQPSVQTDRQEKHSSQKSVEVQNKTETINSVSQAQSIKSISVEQARKRFMYVDIVTESNFEECWSQLQNMIESPILYSTKVNPDKVIPRKTEYGHFLKVGPGRVKIDFNKQNGKIWLQNIYGSKCQGQIFCGVLKGKDMHHYIWFNSSYTYKGVHFPSRQIFDQALLIAKNNLNKKTDSH